MGRRGTPWITKRTPLGAKDGLYYRDTCETETERDHHQHERLLSGHPLQHG